MRRTLLFSLLLLAAATLTLALHPHLITRALISLGITQPPSPRSNTLTLDERLDLVTPGALERMKPYFAAAQIAYPPAAVTIVGLKADKFLRITTGKLPEADFAFLDEIFKASSARSSGLS